MTRLPAKPWLQGAATALILLSAQGCGQESYEAALIVPSVEELEQQEFPSQSEPECFRIEVRAGRLPNLEGKASRLPAGVTTFNVVNRLDGARTDLDGLDLSERAVALWIRGRGPARHRLPQFSIGPVNSGVQEDWTVDLQAGDYLLSLTLGGNAEGIVLVR